MALWQEAFNKLCHFQGVIRGSIMSTGSRQAFIVQQSYLSAMADGKLRRDVKMGATVDIVLKQDQPTGKLTRGIVAAILTNSPTHPHGIKVRLRDGRVGRVQAIIE